MIIEPMEPVQCVHCTKTYPYMLIENAEIHPCAAEYEDEIAERQAAREAAE